MVKRQCLYLYIAARRRSDMPSCFRVFVRGTDKKGRSGASLQYRNFETPWDALPTQSMVITVVGRCLVRAPPSLGVLLQTPSNTNGRTMMITNGISVEVTDDGVKVRSDDCVPMVAYSEDRNEVTVSFRPAGEYIWSNVSRRGKCVLEDRQKIPTSL
jgi:hypothetical protein